MPDVILPDGTRLRFPDDASPAEMEAAVNAVVGQTKGESTSGGRQLTWQQKMVRQAAPSLIGGAIGAAVGTVAAPFTLGLVNPMTAGMAGAAAGEWASQTVLQPWTQAEPSKLQMGVAAAGPAIGPTARAVGRSIPGAVVGLQQYITGQLGLRGQNLAAIYGATSQEVQMLWGQVMRLNKGAPVMIRTTPLATAAEELGEQAAAHFATAAERGIATKLAKVAEGTIQTGKATIRTETGRELGPGIRTVGRGTAETVERDTFVPFDRFHREISRLGVLVRSMAGTTYQRENPATGAAKRAYAEMVEAMDKGIAEASPEMQAAYALAVEGTKRHQVSRFIADAFKRGVRTRTGQPQLAIDDILTNLNRNRELLNKLIGKTEVEELYGTIARFAHIPVSSQVQSAGLRGIAAPERIAVGATISGGAHMLGIGPGESVGAGVVGIVGVEALAQALSSRGGRAVVSMLAREGTPVDQLAVAITQLERRRQAIAEAPALVP